jgi:hypothetical protein
MASQNGQGLGAGRVFGSPRQMHLTGGYESGHAAMDFTFKKTGLFLSGGVISQYRMTVGIK